MRIHHRFINQPFFFPDWEVDTLILGTFNPNTENIVDYYYGREKNKFWRAIELIENLELKSLHGNLAAKQIVMNRKRFGCVDVIKYADVDEDHVQNIIGNGYSDSALFLKKKVTLTYQFLEIKDFLLEKKIARVINTWGKRKNPKLFRDEVQELKTFCERHGIVYVENCPSPSGRSKSTVENIEIFYVENGL
ncbi:MAG TPA: hypothetical protein PKN96_12100 [Flavobacterium sp.]|uniref:hypothetical protein n=1 Tax=Flavobacterium sp. TaxID=239 RepID=UPI002CA210A4|nr:hypothetical protein [Flavobacterium sp.]HNP34026.1 hypothetical protein [Flavobacterium sp.]